MRFLCDDNLGKLTKYLRFLGFDTYFKEPIDNSELLRIAASQERILLSRDKQLIHMTHPFGFLHLTIDEPLSQLLKVIDTFSLKIDCADFLKRCSICNEICVEIDKSRAIEEVFPYILNNQEIIKQCPACKRYYWKGTHYRKLITELRSVIPRDVVVGNWPT